MDKNDTFKDQEPQKPYPIPRHIPMTIVTHKWEYPLPSLPSLGMKIAFAGCNSYWFWFCFSLVEDKQINKLSNGIIIAIIYCVIIIIITFDCHLKTAPKTEVHYSMKKRQKGEYITSSNPGYSVLWRARL